MNTTQEVLKQIAKMSNFNVNIQAKPSIVGTLIRAYCTECGLEIPVDTITVTSAISYDGSFEKFCQEHRHEPVPETIIVVEMPLGRKFRNGLR